MAGKRNMRDYLQKEEESPKDKKDDKSDEVPEGEATKLHYLNCIEKLLDGGRFSDPGEGMTHLERNEMRLEKFCELVAYANEKNKAGH